MKQESDINILVAEEPGILNFDIKKSLKKYGFNIIEKTSKEDMTSLLLNRTPDLTVTSVKSLTKFMPASAFYEIWRSISKWKGNTDTIIFNKELKALTFFPKPFNTDEMINFINKQIKKEKP